MYHNETDEKLQQICETNDEIGDLIKQYKEENEFLVSQITHEIRNPLTLMYSTLQLIEHRNPDIKQINYWGNLKEDMKDVFSLLDRLSEFNHCDKLEIKPTRLDTLLQEIIDDFIPYAKQRHCHITLELANSSLQYIQNYPCDKTKMRQVFINLIKNAVEAVNPNGLINISSEYSSSSHELHIHISNTGEPIAQHELESIFMPFVTTKKTGTGLGLPTSKRIILSHNGTIDVVSNEEQTTFTVKLPIS